MVRMLINSLRFCVLAASVLLISNCSRGYNDPYSQPYHDDYFQNCMPAYSHQGSVWWLDSEYVAISARDTSYSISFTESNTPAFMTINSMGDSLFYSRAEAGVFSTRSPHRPNPIGLHRVEITAVEGRRVRVHNLEAVDGTPILDLKPVLDEDIALR